MEIMLENSFDLFSENLGKTWMMKWHINMVQTHSDYGNLSLQQMSKISANSKNLHNSYRKAIVAIKKTFIQSQYL